MLVVTRIYYIATYIPFYLQKTLCFVLALIDILLTFITLFPYSFAGFLYNIFLFQSNNLLYIYLTMICLIYYLWYIYLNYNILLICWPLFNYVIDVSLKYLVDWKFLQSNVKTIINYLTNIYLVWPSTHKQKLILISKDLFYANEFFFFVEVSTKKNWIFFVDFSRFNR